MDWRTALVIAVSVAAAIGVTVFGVLYGLAKKRLKKMEAELVRCRGRWREATDIVLRIVRQRRNKEMSDEEAYTHAKNAIADWSPVDPNAAGVDNDG